MEEEKEFKEFSNFDTIPTKNTPKNIKYLTNLKTRMVLVFERVLNQLRDFMH